MANEPSNKPNREIKVKYFENSKGRTVYPIEILPKGDWIDLRAAETTYIFVNDFAMIPLGVGMKLPAGYEAIIAPRSSTFKNYGIIMTNGIGIIDNSYCGDEDQWYFPAWALKSNCTYMGHAACKIPEGSRIAQFRILRSMGLTKNDIREVETLGSVSRGGFGSTGK